VIVRHVSSITSSSCADDGANTVIPGTFVSSAMSKTPCADAPSGPVTPARSTAKITGCWCSATSYIT
jgi:hypothetical protein